MHDDVDHHRAHTDQVPQRLPRQLVAALAETPGPCLRLSRSSASHTGSRSRLFTALTRSNASFGNAEAPWQAPAIAPTMAAIVSLSPPSEAARRHASHAWPSPLARRTAKAAGTDSCVATLVPTTFRMNRTRSSRA